MNSSLKYISAPDVALVPEDWKDRESWHFESFVLHSYEDRCLTCGSVHHHSQAFRMFSRRRGEDRRLAPASRIPQELTVIRYNLPPREQPICHVCLNSDKISDIKILVSSDAQWNEAVRRQREAAEAARRHSVGQSTAARAGKAPVPSLEDLF